MGAARGQRDLFERENELPKGLLYDAAFLTQAEERTLLGALGKLSLEAARYKVFTARRRIASFGFGYDFGSNSLTPAPPLPAFLQELRHRVSMLSGVPSRTRSERPQSG
jgi:hypothetical protein